jgi:hypothetical protein
MAVPKLSCQLFRTQAFSAATGRRGILPGNAVQTRSTVTTAAITNVEEGSIMTGLGPMNLADRNISLICGTGFLCLLIGYNAAKFANGVPMQFTAMDGLSLLCSGFLLFYGMTRRPTVK